MIANYTQELSATAISQIKTGSDPDVYTQVVYMRASLRGNEPPVINILYQNPELYSQNKEAVDADIEAFRQKVFAIFNNDSQEELNE